MIGSENRKPVREKGQKCAAQRWDISGTLKTAIDRLYAPMVNKSGGTPKEIVLLMTSGGSPIDHILDWYRNLESWLKWKDIGTAMNDLEKAAQIGASIR